MEEDNVTIRKKLGGIHSSSYESLPNLETSSPLSSSSNRLYSLPDISTVCYNELEELKNIIEDLKLQLSGAHEEIDKLILNNNNLQQIIKSKDLKISKLLHLSSPSTHRKEHIKTPKQKSLTKKQIDFLDLDIHSSPFINNPIKKVYKNTEELITSDNNVSDSCKTSRIDSTNTNIHSKEKEITILSTQQGTGLASALTYSRWNNKYEKYKISGLTKPYASTKEVLKECHNLKLTSADKIVLIIGENDINPCSILIELTIALKTLQNCSVILLNIFENKHLNVKLLNKKIHLLCNNFRNCHYLEVKLKSNAYICNKLNLTIDSLDYNDKYLPFLKHSNKCLMPSENQVKKIIHNTNSLDELRRSRTTVQTTLLDYFPRSLYTRKAKLNKYPASEVTRTDILQIDENSYVDGARLTLTPRLRNTSEVRNDKTFFRD